MKSLVKIIVFSTLTLACLPLFLHAQISNPSNPNDSLGLSSEPQFPKPDEDVTVSIDGYSTDLDAATIIWSVNNKEVLRGIGKKQITINVGKMGKITTVSAVVLPQSGTPIKKSLAVYASDVHILWQANTYTPPFYKGKSQFTAQSTITVVAIPEFTGQNSATTPESLIYKWTLNDYVLNDQSGYGKQSVTFDGNYWGRDEELKVAITTRDGSFSTEKSILIHPEKPSLLVYENNPLLGVLTNHAIINTFSLNKNSPEVSLFAAPYFVRSNLLEKGDTTFDWSINGKSINENNGNTITFRNTDQSQGTSIIGLEVTQKDMGYQSQSTRFSISYK